jgi:hypothetical protein
MHRRARWQSQRQEKNAEALQSPCRLTESRQDARPEGVGVTRERNVIALFKGQVRYIFVYDDESRDALIDDIRDKAANPAITINWFDAAVLTERVRNHQESPQEEY